MARTVSGQRSGVASVSSRTADSSREVDAPNSRASAAMRVAELRIASRRARASGSPSVNDRRIWSIASTTRPSAAGAAAASISSSNSARRLPSRPAQLATASAWRRAVPTYSSWAVISAVSTRASCPTVSDHAAPSGGWASRSSS